MLNILHKTICLGCCLFSINVLADTKQDKYCDLGVNCTFHPRDEVAVMGTVNREKGENGNYNYDGQLENGEYACHIIQKNAIFRTFLYIAKERYYLGNAETLYLEKGEKYETDVKFRVGGFRDHNHNYLAFFVTAFPSIDPQTEVTVNCKKL